MKFAVVEYSSKTGRVWRHHDDHPNFLADPQREIDPTSFGCYVSALRGEHIPLTGLAIGPVNAISPVSRLQRKIYKRLVGKWPDYAIDYLRSFDTLMVVHQISDGREVTAFTKRLKKKFPRTTILGITTQPFGILHEYWRTHPQPLADFREFTAHVNVFITIVKSRLPAWQKISLSPVVYFPQAYPVTFAQQFFRPRRQKHRVLYVAGVATRPHVTRGCDVAQKLQARFPDYLIAITQAAAHSLVPYVAPARYQEMPFVPWRDHLRALGQVSLVVNTDYTSTRGRVQVDCAAVGTPSIGANSDGQADLWPLLPAGETTSVDQLVEQGARLLTDVSWYDTVVARARQQLRRYDYPQAAVTITRLVERYRSRS